MIEIKLELGKQAHTVTVGADILTNPDNYPIKENCKIAVVGDTAIANSHLPTVAATLANLGEVVTIEVPSGESSKSWQQLISLCDQFADANLSRTDYVVAVGGGVLCDLVGFAAATYLRGLSHIMLPTTLLAQVDASVGGKTAINIAAGKNLVGAFHQPVAVLADVTTLATMPAREFNAGLAECVKHGMLEPELFSFLHDNLDDFAQGPAMDATLLAELVARNVRVKAAVVTADAHETKDVRTHLNLGHTFAHAFEAALGYGNLLHGEAVAIGLVAACHLSHKLGLASAELAPQIVAMLNRLQLPTTLPEHDRTQVLTAMTKDKKNLAGKLRFVVLRDLGHVEVTDEVTESQVNEVLDLIQED